MAVTQRIRASATELFRRAKDEATPFHLRLSSEAMGMEPEPEDRPKLLATIEAEIIPRLMLAHRVEPKSPPLCAESRLPPTSAELHEFARIATCHDLPGALAFVETLCREGLSLEAVLLELVGPTARLLGEQWKSDLRSFAEVSAGLGTLQQVVHILGPSFAPSLPHRGLVVLIAAPGEQHTLGLYLVAEFLRRAGWGVQVSPSITEAELIKVVASERVELLGISVSNGHLLDAVSGLIAAARKASRNPNLRITIGGSLELADYAEQTGVAFCAADPREVVRLLERHASVRERRN